MTYHPRCEAGGSTYALRATLPFTKFLSRAHDDASVHGTITERSAARELRLAHASLEHRFPDESFSPACIAADGQISVGLLAVLIALLGVVAAQIIL